MERAAATISPTAVATAFVRPRRPAASMTGVAVPPTSRSTAVGARAARPTIRSAVAAGFVPPRTRPVTAGDKRAARRTSRTTVATARVVPRVIQCAVATEARAVPRARPATAGGAARPRGARIPADARAITRSTAATGSAVSPTPPVPTMEARWCASAAVAIPRTRVRHRARARHRARVEAVSRTRAVCSILAGERHAVTAKSAPIRRRPGPCSVCWCWGRSLVDVDRVRSGRREPGSARRPRPAAVACGARRRSWLRRRCWPADGSGTG